MCRAWPAVLVGLCGLMLALALPFAPVFADETTVSWPRAGEPVSSTTVTLAPYRPATLVATLPCSAVGSGKESDNGTVLTTATADGLAVRDGILQLGAESVPLVPGDGPDCRTTVDAGPDGVTVTAPDGRVTELPDAPVPKVFGFRTDLTPGQAAGMTVTATVVTPFGTSPTPLKFVLIALHVLAIGAALVLLPRSRIRRRRPRKDLWWIDAGVIGALGLWAVIGPLAVDDGWASVIARNVATSGDPGNYFRWWDAAEVPFVLSQQLLAPLTEISLAPLWLRLPSTALAVATWFVLTRGVLPAALPVTVGVRLMAAVALLVAWLPFNLGTRPESYVAFSVTVVLAIVWRSRTPAGLGWACLVAGLTTAISPTAVVVLAPFLVFGVRIAKIVRLHTHSRLERIGCILLLGATASVALLAMFADQTWAALLTATDWHNHFGPSLPWWQEMDRYRYLLGDDQQGSYAKRTPVLLTLAMLVVVALRRRPGPALQLAAVVLVGLALMALSPSKWSYHLGALAGVFAAFLVLAVHTGSRRRDKASTAGGVLVAGAVLLALAGTDAWWVPAVYDVPWPAQSWWIGVLVVAVGTAIAVAARRSWPTTLTVTASVAVVALLFGTFAAAPVRRPEGSLALMNVHRVSGGPVCGLADAIEVLPDGDLLEPAGGAASTSGFVTAGGYLPAAPPPDPPGTGASTFLWGSYGQSTGSLVTPWFSVPPLRSDQGLAVSVSGRTTDGNELAFEFVDGTTVLGDATPVDRVAPDEDPEHPLWRSIGIDAAEVPDGADRVRLRAVDGRTDNFGWLALTGPRLRSVVGLEEFLAGRRPVLISWPVAFLYPCFRDIPSVLGGVAQTPGAVISGPRPRGDEETDQVIGGTFAELAEFGELGELPARLAGHPDVDWGALFLSGDDAARDAYDRTVTQVERTGWDDTGHVAPEP